jgi:hypothetical protein
MNVNQQQLQVSLVSNGLVPDDGRRAIPITLDFTGADITQYIFDYQNMQSRGFMSMVQTVYVDNSANSNALVITVGGTGQQIQAPPNTQGYYPVLCSNPIRFVFSSPANSSLVTVQLINVAISGQVWNA